MTGGWRDRVFASALGAGLLLSAYAAYIPAKAWLAQRLLERAWDLAADDHGPARPWPWADTVPLARLRQSRLGVDQVVLSGASGRVLAFGPGHVTGTVLPGDLGNSVISAHRDTHFSWLQRLQVGDGLEVERVDGSLHRFRVADIAVYDESAVHLLDAQLGDRLTLVTCFPFAGVNPGTPWRYVVSADRLSP